MVMPIADRIRTPPESEACPSASSGDLQTTNLGGRSSNLFGRATLRQGALLGPARAPSRAMALRKRNVDAPLHLHKPSNSRDISTDQWRWKPIDIGELVLEAQAA